MRKNLINLILAAIIGLASLSGVKASIKGNIRYIQSEENANSYVEAKADYKLPGEIKGSTFIDFYKNKKGYFGKTSLEKEFGPKVRVRAEAAHANEPFAQAGLGANVVVPYIPKEIFAKISFIPLWFDVNGRVKDKVIAGYSVKINLPKGFKLKSFGEWNVAASDGVKWNYGEIDLGRKFSFVNVSYNPALKEDGDAVPSVEHRASIGVDF